ncbi:MAG: geranylgeranyl reductase family protein [Deltaproteobacteria bacterium]|nr:geranylgeranyl reductase family protein [Deltaproteobacteria bacterium]
MDEHYHVIISGAGPAGCAAAARLSAAGKRVLLADKARFPRDKVCGDGLSGAALEQLAGLGLLESVMAQNPHPSPRVVVRAPNGRVLDSPTPPTSPEIPHGCVLPRRKLDNALFESVSAMDGVTTAQGFAVDDLVLWNSRVHGIRGTIDGKEVFVRCDYFIAADGAHSHAAKKLGLYASRRNHLCMGIRAYMEGIEGLDRGIEILYENKVLPGYGWVFPTGPDSANVGCGIHLKLAAGMNLKELFDTFVQQDPRLRNAVLKKSTLRAWPIPLGSAPGRRASKNALVVGDAASFVDPLTGEGIYYALKSGRMAAEAICRTVAAGDPPAASSRRYEAAWRKAFRLREFVPASILQALVSKPFWVNLVVDKAAKRRKTRDLLVGAISHQIPKARLFIFR